MARARCYPAERALFLHPVVEAPATLVSSLPPAELAQAAGDRAGALAAVVPEVASVLGTVPAEQSRARTYRRRAFDAVATFPRRLSGARPLLLVLEDVHDAGASTVEFPHYLARHAVGSRMLPPGGCVPALFDTSEKDDTASRAAKKRPVTGAVDTHRKTHPRQWSITSAES